MRSGLPRDHGRQVPGCSRQKRSRDWPGATAPGGTVSATPDSGRLILAPAAVTLAQAVKRGSWLCGEGEAMFEDAPEVVEAEGEAAVVGSGGGVCVGGGSGVLVTGSRLS